jgi:hypothetical protein
LAAATAEINIDDAPRGEDAISASLTRPSIICGSV